VSVTFSTTPQGTLVFHLMGALAQFERSLIAERTAAGRAAARKRGVKFGRPAKLSSQQACHARELRDGDNAVPESRAAEREQVHGLSHAESSDSNASH
jgi:DNA invertase Pin-like site-specific DNA recombinase